MVVALWHIELKGSVSIQIGTGRFGLSVGNDEAVFSVMLPGKG
jgi:hypothetical protein